MYSQKKTKDEGERGNVQICDQHSYRIYIEAMRRQNSLITFSVMIFKLMREFKSLIIM